MGCNRHLPAGIYVPLTHCSGVWMTSHSQVTHKANRHATTGFFRIFASGWKCKASSVACLSMYIIIYVYNVQRLCSLHDAKVLQKKTCNYMTEEPCPPSKYLKANTICGYYFQWIGHITDLAGIKSSNFNYQGGCFLSESVQVITSTTLLGQSEAFIARLVHKYGYVRLMVSYSWTGRAKLALQIDVSGLALTLWTAYYTVSFLHRPLQWLAYSSLQLTHIYVTSQNANTIFAG